MKSFQQTKGTVSSQKRCFSEMNREEVQGTMTAGCFSPILLSLKEEDRTCKSENWKYNKKSNKASNNE